MVAKKLPLAIEYVWVDPWTGEFCSGARLAYTRQRMATGFYRRHALGSKTIAKQFTGPRKPKLVLTVHRA